MIVWSVALPAEAEPLVAARGLRRSGDSTPWPLYTGEGGEEALVVSGVGRSAAAAACGWVHGFLGMPAHATWLNAGIAGHSDRAVGQVLCGHRVIDRATGRGWYPPQLPGHTLPGDTVYTVDRPETEFRARGAYDMEAAGFLAATARLATAEAAQVVKIVSDSPAAPAARLDRASVRRLMTAGLPGFESMACALLRVSRTLAERFAPPPGYELLVTRGRYSVTQQRQLRKLLERHRALGGSLEPIEGLAGVPAKKALRSLTAQVERAGIGA